MGSLGPEADYIIAGGGLTGCVVASRLKERDPTLKVLILEAGVDPSSNPNTQSFPGLFSLLGSELDWSYPTLPQANTDDRPHAVHAGKALGGGSVINFGGWTRGDAADYDQWARMVGDERWSYEGLLPFFRKSETFFDAKADPKHHGFDGPITVTADSQTVTAGQVLPRLTYGIGGRGLVNGDTLSGDLATDATTASAPGAYAIGQGTVAASANYQMTFVPGTLTIARSLSVAAAILPVNVYWPGASAD